MTPSEIIAKLDDDAVVFEHVHSSELYFDHGQLARALKRQLELITKMDCHYPEIYWWTGTSFIHADDCMKCNMRKEIARILGGVE